MNARHELSALPYRILIGWLPGISAKEAKAFVRDLADRHCESPTSSGYAIAPFEEGYAYEIQEGGAGRGYLTPILKSFKKARDEGVPTSEVERVVLVTQTRKVQVELLGQGLLALQLPESSPAQPTEWLEANAKLSPLAPSRVGVLAVGMAIFFTGVVVAVGAGFVRHQPYDPPAPETLAYKAADLPHSQWRRIASLPPRVYVTNLEFKGGKWVVEREATVVSEEPEAGAGEPEFLPDGIPNPAYVAPVAPLNPEMPVMPGEPGALPIDALPPSMSIDPAIEAERGPN